MINQPLISIVMPAYNAEKTLEHAVQSVIQQTYTQWELWIVDDCSTDQTYCIAEKLAKQDPRIRLLRNEKNCGVSETRNHAVAASKGDWIAFLDSDDMWTSNKLQKQMELSEREAKADLVFTGSAFIDADGNPAKYQLHVPQTISYRELLKQNVVSCSSVLVKKSWMLRYPMKYDNMHEDYAVWLQIVRGGGHLYGIDEPLLIYRLSEHSKSSNKKKAAFMTFKVYRYLGLNLVQTFYYFGWYAWRNVRKYKKINAGF